MKPTQALHARGQSLWLDNITRSMLESGQIQRFIDQYSVTGLTSNPTIFDKAIASGDYDDVIAEKAKRGITREDLFFELAIKDLRRAADMFEPVHQRTDGVDGWVSLEVSPLLAYDTQQTVTAATTLHRRADRPNLLIKIPGTPEGLPAIEEAIASGIPVNVTLLFSDGQYQAAAEAFLRGVERRIELGLDPNVGSVASVFMSRWDASVADEVPADLRNRLGLAMGLKVYQAYRQLMDSDRWQRAANAGARIQRLLWASTKTKDPDAPDTLYVHCLAAPFTVNTMPEDTLEAFFDHGEAGQPMPADGGDADALFAGFTARGVDVSALAATLQADGTASFVKAWNDLMQHISKQSPSLT